MQGMVLWGAARPAAATNPPCWNRRSPCSRETAARQVTAFRAVIAARQQMQAVTRKRHATPAHQLLSKVPQPLLMLSRNQILAATCWEACGACSST